jgi:hypothetical protein
MSAAPTRTRTSSRKRKPVERFESDWVPRDQTDAACAARSVAAAARETEREERAKGVLAKHAPETHELPCGGLSSGTRAYVYCGEGMPEALRAAVVALVGENKLIRSADDPCWKVRGKSTRARSSLRRRLCVAAHRLSTRTAFFPLDKMRHPDPPQDKAFKHVSFAALKNDEGGREVLRLLRACLWATWLDDDAYAVVDVTVVSRVGNNNPMHQDVVTGSLAF